VDAEPTDETVPLRTDGFVFAAKEGAVTAESGLAVEVAGKDLALFRVDGKLHAIDGLCPHEGAPLAQGEFRDGVVTCPWHGWTFDACSGCSLAPPKNDVKHYPTLVEDGNVFVKLSAAADNATAAPRPRNVTPVEAALRLSEIIDEAPEVRTFRFDNRDGKIPFDHPGKFLKVCVPADDGEVWRSFTISSSPTRCEFLDLTIKLNPAGIVSRWLFEQARPGMEIKLKGSQGGFYFDSTRHTEPLVLVSAGSGATPMMSIARFIESRELTTACTFLHGARRHCDVLFQDECMRLAAVLPGFKYHVTLSQPHADWTGGRGRLDAAALLAQVDNPLSCRYFLCGPSDFMELLSAGLTAAGVPSDRIHTEQFHASPVAVSG
jgi:ferredoxin-NADP reductase/nitrite reductase/ring-hydroxylating ferredoxin subunit